MVKLFIDATYADRQRFNNRVQTIIHVDENFGMNDIVEKISELRYSESYTIKEIKILSQINE